MTEVSLRKEIGFVGATSVMLSSIIGSGIYVSPKGVVQHMGSVGGGLLVWLACGLLSLCSSLCYMELGTMFMKSGAEVHFLLNGYGKWLSFIFTWSLSLAIKPSTFALLSLAFSKYVLNADGCSDAPEYAFKLLAICVVGFVVFINCFSVKLSTQFITVFSIGKAISLSAIIIIGIIHLAKGQTKSFENMFEGTNTDSKSIALAIYKGMWAYDGWNQLTFVTEENPAKIVPRAMTFSVMLVTLLYLFTNVAYLSVMSIEELLEASAVAGVFGEKTLGKLSFIIPLVVAWSVMGTCIDSCFAGSRVSYTASREGFFPSIFSMIHVTRMTPAPGVILNGLIAIIMIVFNDIDQLIDYLGIINFLFYGLCCFAVILFRWTKPKMKRPFKIFIGLPILSAASFAALTVIPFVTDPSMQFIMAGLFVLASLLFYIPFYCLNIHFPGLGAVTGFIQKLILVVPEDKKK